MSSKHTFVENNVSDQDYNINQNTSILNSFFPFFHDLSPSHPIPSILVGHTTFCISLYLPAFSLFYMISLSSTSFSKYSHYLSCTHVHSTSASPLQLCLQIALPNYQSTVIVIFFFLLLYSTNNTTGIENRLFFSFIKLLLPCRSLLMYFLFPAYSVFC